MAVAAYADYVLGAGQQGPAGVHVVLEGDGQEHDVCLGVCPCTGTGVSAGDEDGERVEDGLDDDDGLGAGSGVQEEVDGVVVGTWVEW